MLPAELIFNIFTSCSEPVDRETFTSPPCSLCETVAEAKVTSSLAQGRLHAHIPDRGCPSPDVSSASAWLKARQTNAVNKTVRPEVFIKMSVLAIRLCVA